MGIRLAAIAALALSCGGSQHGTTDADQPRVITYGPLGARGDAKRPNQAVILGTDDKNGSTVLPLPAAQAKVTVDAMYVQMGGSGPATGGMTPVKLAIAPNPDQSVQVGIYEEFNGGTGAQWRAGVWVAAIVAAGVLGKDLTDFTFSASSGGYIDGASASGLMAGGFLAAMTGSEVDPKATMTGIINPDGTIGPVGGIPEKFLGSIEKGKRRLGYPIGMRKAKSEATGADVDLVELAKAHGAEAVEIADVHEAYKLLTGKTLPDTVPLAESDMALDAGTTAALEDKYKEWQQKLAKEWGSIVQLESAGKLPALLGTLRDYTKQYSDLAEQLHKKGLVGAAYQRMLYAWTFATTTNTTYELLNKVKKGDINGAVAELQTLDQLGGNINAVFQKIGALKPKTLGGHLQMIAAFKTALRSYVYRQLASQITASTVIYLQGLASEPATKLAAPETADLVVAAIAPTLLYVGRTTAESTLALQELEFEKEDSVTYMCSLPNVKRMATSFESAAAAGVSYFDTMVIDELAKGSSLSVDDARNRFSAVEPDYLVAYLMTKLSESEGLPKDLKTGWGEKSLAWGLMSLASSELAYFDSAELIAKYYSLGVHTDDNNKVDKIEFEQAFTNMLASAERNARANARAAKIAAGAVPVQAKLAYQIAVIERDGDLSEKVDALGEFWAASAFSQTAVMLARN
ncbi:MAG: S16 family serine protease [Deltaproteobacteria bacterium]